MLPIVDVSSISVSQDGAVKISANGLRAFVSGYSNGVVNQPGANSSSCKNTAGCANSGCTGHNTACSNTGCGD